MGILENVHGQGVETILDALNVVSVFSLDKSRMGRTNMSDLIKWKTIPEEELLQIYSTYQRGYYEDDFRNYFKAVEARLKQLNAPVVNTNNNVPEYLYEVIKGAINKYRMSNMIDSEYGDGYPLVDLMTANGNDISDGIKEIEYLTDFIWSEVLSASPQKPQEHGKLDREAVSDALEEAAKICDDNLMSWADDDWNGAAKDCAKRIRALIKRNTPKEGE